LPGAQAGADHDLPGLDLAAVNQADAGALAVLDDGLGHLSMGEELDATLYQDLMAGVGYLVRTTPGITVRSHSHGHAKSSGSELRVIWIRHVGYRGPHHRVQ